ncbi:unnamed protein product, partial [marine sediment metagenome]
MQHGQTGPDAEGDGPDRIQELKQLAVAYYEHVHQNRTAELAYAVGGESFTAVDYFRRRGHSTETLDHFHVGLADGHFYQFALGQGYTQNELRRAGLLKPNSPRDYWSAGLVLFPHCVDGQVSHFSQKDPSGRYGYQAKNEHRHPGCLWQNQDAARNVTELLLVEGENDLLSVAGKASYEAVIACNGSLSQR